MERNIGTPREHNAKRLLIRGVVGRARVYGLAARPLQEQGEVVQSGHIAYKPHRNTGTYIPKGWETIRDQWNSKCSFTAKANGKYALCNILANTHAWRNPSQNAAGFICARRIAIAEETKVVEETNIASPGLKLNASDATSLARVGERE